MAKSKRPRGPKIQKAQDDDDSDAQASVPSSKEVSSQYYHDEVDKFHEDKTASLLAAGVRFQSDDEDAVDSDDEVMALDSSGSEDEAGDEEQDSMGSDLEEHPGGEMPNELAWGQKKKLYYDTDYVAEDRKKSTNQQEEEAEAEEEEVEAQRIQKRLAGNLDEEDYGLDFLQAFAPKQKPAGQKIEKDLKKMSEKEKLKMLKKESPELLELLQDFKAKLTELEKDLKPLVQMVKDGIIPPGKGSSYLQTKYQLYLNYCTNISYYLVLKAKRIPVHGHPVIERLVSYRNLINDLGVVDQRLSSEMSLLLKEKDSSANKSTSAADSPVVQPRKKKNPLAKKATLKMTATDEMDNSDLDDDAALKYYQQMENALQIKRKRATEPVEDEETDMADFDPKAKRAITRQIAKNRGLTPKRKKIDRNPRVKHREKFRRAKIRRKGQVREVRKEESRYSGERSGIRAGIKKSIKLK